MSSQLWRLAAVYGVDVNALGLSAGATAYLIRSDRADDTPVALGTRAADGWAPLVLDTDDAVFIAVPQD